MPLYQKSEYLCISSAAYFHDGILRATQQAKYFHILSLMLSANADKRATFAPDCEYIGYKRRDKSSRTMLLSTKVFSFSPSVLQKNPIHIYRHLSERIYAHCDNNRPVHIAYYDISVQRMLPATKSIIPILHSSANK